MSFGKSTYDDLIEKLTHRTQIRVDSGLTPDSAFLRVVGDDGFVNVLKIQSECKSIIQHCGHGNYDNDVANYFAQRAAEQGDFDDEMRAGVAFGLLLHEVKSRIETPDQQKSSSFADRTTALPPRGGRRTPLSG